MVTAPVEVLVDNAATDRFLHLVAESSTGEVVGTITGVDHVEAFDDPESGASLWCLTADPYHAPPGHRAGAVAGARRPAGGARPRVRRPVGAGRQRGRDPPVRAARVHAHPDPVREAEEPDQRAAVPAPARPTATSELNPYARIIADEAMRRGIRVDVTDPDWGELRLTHGGRTVMTRESLSELTTAVAMSRCDDKRVTRRVLARAGLPVPRGPQRHRSTTRTRRSWPRWARWWSSRPGASRARASPSGCAHRRRCGRRVALARRYCPDVLLEEQCEGEDLRVVVIDHEVVAAAVRRPASVIGDGVHTIAELIERQSRRRAAATGGESRIPLDEMTRAVVREAGHDHGRRAARGAGAGGAADRQPAHRRHHPRRHQRTASGVGATPASPPAGRCRSP